MTFLVGFMISLAVAAGGYLARALTRGGAVAATLVGTAILWRTGVPGLAALGAFFIGASLVSRLAPDAGVRALDAKGTTRDPWQVLANGGGAAAAALLAGTAEAALWAVTASLAAAAADTWATSTGGWSRSPPRHVLTWKKVPPGTSGGVTLLGSVGALAGALTVGAAAGLAGGSAALLPLALTIGMGGMFLDSVAGALLQGKFHCDTCAQATEQRVHRCGAPTRRVAGLPWLTNDGVNALATIAAAVLGFLAFRS